MLIGARQDNVFGGRDVPEKMAILKDLGYDFLELSLAREEVAALGPGVPAPYLAALARTGLPIRSTSMGHFGGFAALREGVWRKPWGHGLKDGVLPIGRGMSQIGG